MLKSKKIITFSLKLLIGIISFWIIYNRISDTPHLKSDWYSVINSPNIIYAIVFSCLLMPLNWGIECFKWNQITQQIEKLPYLTSVKSVMAGICVGNIVPGRAMEFLAKIMFFKSENRPSITLLHFINGMFQMLITVTLGTISIALKFSGNNLNSTLIYALMIAGLIMITVFCLAILNVSKILSVLKKIKWIKKFEFHQNIKFSNTLIVKLILLSVIRYGVFITQFYLIYSALSPNSNILSSLMGVAIYFMLTSLIPMISFIEPAIRAAIALFVFNDDYASSTIVIVFTSTFIWIINVIIPSIIGYIIILKEKLNFKIISDN
jgi:hypothetical protein